MRFSFPPEHGLRRGIPDFLGLGSSFTSFRLSDLDLSCSSEESSLRRRLDLEPRRDVGGSAPPPPPEMEKWFPEFPWKGTHSLHAVRPLVVPLLVQEKDLKEEEEKVNVFHTESSQAAEFLIKVYSKKFCLFYTKISASSSTQWMGFKKILDKKNTGRPSLRSNKKLWCLSKHHMDVQSSQPLSVVLHATVSSIVAV